MDVISVRGAATHNLKHVDVDLPRGKLIVITGLSGSGKSSLAFDTLYAEGQRRYVESLSVYARQFLELMPRPEVESIEGLSPSISIDQKSAGSNPRSTVGTATELADYLRLLFARAGTPHCPTHGLALRADPVAAMVDRTLTLSEGVRLMVLAPIVRGGQKDVGREIEPLFVKGFTRFRIDGEVVMLERAPLPGEFEGAKDADVVVDRLRVKPDVRERLSESFQSAAEISGGRVIAAEMDGDAEYAFTTRYACPECDFTVGSLEPRLFSANSPVGCCPTCRGTGVSSDFSLERILRDPTASLEGTALEGWGPMSGANWAKLVRLSQTAGFSLSTRWRELSEDVRSMVLYGGGAAERLDPPFIGVVNELRRFWAQSDNPLRRALERFRAEVTCTDCGGSGLCETARHVRLGEGDAMRTLPELSAESLSSLDRYFADFRLSGAKAQVADRILSGITSRLRFLNDVGLGYLTLGRRADTLSGGESQRIRLASQIGSGLTGVLYVLDEPSIGLHQRDNDRLIETLRRLRDLGNTVVVVEHDEDAIRAADFVVDMGPGAGEAGGRIVAAGTLAEVTANPESLTGRYLSGNVAKRPPRPAFDAKAADWLELVEASGHNLKDVTLRIPMGAMTTVAGISGSGKSSLVLDTLLPALAAHYHRAQTVPLPHREIRGLEHFDKVISVDQSPIGRTPRSNPATYTGLFSAIRDVFAQTLTARERGYDARRFSFNTKGGRCEACQGDGVVKVEMQFLPDIYVACDVCGGKRYNRETLEVRYKGLSIADVLELTVEEAIPYFDAHPGIVRKLETLRDVGLGYIRLGQSATTFSGGEAQRIKLATELARTDTGRTLYILDEPTTGLHFADVDQLLDVLRRLTALGNTVLVIEHNLDVLASSDWVVDMGPGGGDEGGRIVAEGTPEDVAANPASVTGPYLAKLIPKHRNGG